MSSESTSSTSSLRLAWNRCWREAGGRTPPEPVFEELRSRYLEAGRHYHTLQHLQECLAWWETTRATANSPEAVELALWFHDAIYDPQRADNEVWSAALARDHLQAASVSSSLIEPIEALILATRHIHAPSHPDEQLLIDIDLAILGAGPQRYAEYERQIRAEYAFVPEKVFCEKRQEILQRFLDRPVI